MDVSLLTNMSYPKQFLMWLIVFSVIIFGQSMVRDNQSKDTGLNVWVETPKTKNFEYWQVMFSPMSNGECLSVELGYSFKVMKGELPKGIGGTWYPKDRKIVFLEGRETTVDTMAHEGYHVVQTLMRKYGSQMEDHHGAYMQGSITGCIKSLLDNE